MRIPTKDFVSAPAVGLRGEPGKEGGAIIYHPTVGLVGRKPSQVSPAPISSSSQPRLPVLGSPYAASASPQKFRPLSECSQVRYSLCSSTCFAYHVCHHSFQVPGKPAASHSSSASTIRWPLFWSCYPADRCMSWRP